MGALLPLLFISPFTHGDSSYRGEAFRSFVELRDREVVRQGTDYSCAAAALATLLTYEWSDPISESDVLDVLARIVTPEVLSQRRDRGFTLLDLQRVARALGYRAQGFRLSPEALDKLTAPVIVFVSPEGYRHFVVLRGIVGDRVVIADPARGNLTLPRHRFLDWWQREDGTGVLLAVEPIRPSKGGGLDVHAVEGQRPALIDARSLLPAAALTQFRPFVNQ